MVFKLLKIIPPFRDLVKLKLQHILQFPSYIKVKIYKNNLQYTKNNKKIYDHVTPFLKRTNSSVSNCSFREEFRDLIKNNSKIAIFLVDSEALARTFFSGGQSEKDFKSLAGFG